eukprot:scaffold6584_cov48-Attheya_sp.AAC.2
MTRLFGRCSTSKLHLALLVTVVFTTREIVASAFVPSQFSSFVSTTTNPQPHPNAWFFDHKSGSHHQTCRMKPIRKERGTRLRADVSNNGNGNEWDDGGDVRRYFATCIPGLHEVLAQELVDLGAMHVHPSGNSGVHFEGPLQLGLEALMYVRTAHRMMEWIAETPADDPVETRDDLHDFISRAVDAKWLLGNGQGGLHTLSVQSIVNGRVPKDLCHSHYTALTVKNALVDSVRHQRQDRPNVDLDDPDVPLLCALRGDSRGAHVTLYRCLHPPGSLHKRGYRGSTAQDSVIHKAAMKESLAAGLLYMAGWDKLCHAAKEDGLPAVLVDPMTGSGSLPIEAALMAADIAPGLMRIRCSSASHKLPPVVRWRDSGGPDAWKQLVQDATQRARAGMEWVSTPNESSSQQQNNCVIMCNEVHPGASALARNTISNAGLANVISLSAETNACDWILPPGKVVEGRTIMVSNPPWGIRLDGAEEVESSWTALRDFMRRECVGAEAWVLSGDKKLTKLLCMKRTRRIPIQTGEQDLRWIQYHVFPKPPPRDDREPFVTNEQMEPSTSSTPPKQTQEIN